MKRMRYKRVVGKNPLNNVLWREIPLMQTLHASCDIGNNYNSLFLLSLALAAIIS